MPDDSNSELQTQIRKLRDCFLRVGFLGQLKLPELDKLMEALKRRRCPSGHTVIKQGDKGDAFYAISTGQVDVTTNGKKLASLGSGEYFGESALVTDDPRSATVVTTAETELYVLYKEDFRKILMANPSIAASIKAHMSKIKGSH